MVHSFTAGPVVCPSTWATSLSAIIAYIADCTNAVSALSLPTSWGPVLRVNNGTRMTARTGRAITIPKPIKIHLAGRLVFLRGRATSSDGAPHCGQNAPVTSAPQFLQKAILTHYTGHPSFSSHQSRGALLLGQRPGKGHPSVYPLCQGLTAASARTCSPWRSLSPAKPAGF